MTDGFRGGKIPNDIKAIRKVVTYENILNFNRCIRCGRKLKTVESKQVGFGPHCYKKHLAENSGKYKNRRLF